MQADGEQEVPDALVIPGFGSLDVDACPGPSPTINWDNASGVTQTVVIANDGANGAASFVNNGNSVAPANALVPGDVVQLYVATNTATASIFVAESDPGTSGCRTAITAIYDV